MKLKHTRKSFRYTLYFLLSHTCDLWNFQTVTALSHRNVLRCSTVVIFIDACSMFFFICYQCQILFQSVQMHGSSPVSQCYNLCIHIYTVQTKKHHHSQHTSFKCHLIRLHLVSINVHNQGLISGSARGIVRSCVLVHDLLNRTCHTLH
jgi:hypothetical protein